MFSYSSTKNKATINFIGLINDLDFLENIYKDSGASTKSVLAFSFIKVTWKIDFWKNSSDPQNWDSLKDTENSEAATADFLANLHVFVFI